MAQTNASRRVDPRAANYAQAVAADTAFIVNNLGFIPSVTGTIDVQPGMNSGYVTIPVVAGLFYPIDAKAVRLSTSTALQTCIVFLQGVGD